MSIYTYTYGNNQQIYNIGYVNYIHSQIYAYAYGNNQQVYNNHYHIDLYVYDIDKNHVTEVANL